MYNWCSFVPHVLTAVCTRIVSLLACLLLCVESFPPQADYAGISIISTNDPGSKRPHHWWLNSTAVRIVLNSRIFQETYTGIYLCIKTEQTVCLLQRRYMCAKVCHKYNEQRPKNCLGCCYGTTLLLDTTVHTLTPPQVTKNKNSNKNTRFITGVRLIPPPWADTPTKQFKR